MLFKVGEEHHFRNVVGGCHGCTDCPCAETVPVPDKVTKTVAHHTDALKEALSDDLFRRLSKNSRSKKTGKGLAYCT